MSDDKILGIELPNQKAAAPTPAQPCGQCAHLIKTVEELQRHLAIETDTSNKSVMRYIRQNASLDELKRDNLNLREDFDRLHSVALERTEEIARLREQLDAQTSAQATRSDSVVAEGVTLPVGEKPATGELVDRLQEVAEWIEATGPSEHQTPWLIHRDVVREAIQRLTLK